MRAESSLCGPGLVLTFSKVSVPHLLNGENNHKDLHLQAAMRPGVQLADQTAPSTSARTQAAKGKSSGSAASYFWTAQPLGSGVLGALLPPSGQRPLGTWNQ